MTSAKQHFSFRVWIGLLLGVVGCGMAWNSVEAGPYGRPNVSEDQRRLRRVVYWQNKMKLLKLRRQENTILDDIEEMDRKTVKLHQHLLSLQKQTKALQKQVVRAQANLRIENQASKEVLAQIQPRLRLLYRMARLGHARLLLGARSLHHMAQRWRAIQLLSVRDVKILREYQRIRRRAENISEEWKAKRAHLIRLMKEVGQQQQKLSKQRKEKTYILKALYREKDMYRRTLRALRGRGAFIQLLVSKWQKKSPTIGLALQKGQLPWPIHKFSPFCEKYMVKKRGSFRGLVCLKRRLLQRSLRCPLGRKGLVLHVPVGTPAVAIAKGKVAARGWKRGFGQFVIVDHGHTFYTIYGHLSYIVVQKGEEVNVNYPIGLTGATGTLGPPILYFGLRRGIQAMNPQLWLKPVKQ